MRHSTWMVFALGLAAGLLLAGGFKPWLGEARAATGQGAASAYSVASFSTGNLYGAYLVDGRNGDVFIVKGHERPEPLGRLRAR